MEKIIICQGDAQTPARFWAWAVIERKAFTEEMKEKGMVESECTAYLTIEEKEYLNG